LPRVTGGDEEMQLYACAMCGRQHVTRSRVIEAV